MGAVALSGNDVITVQDRVLSDFADANVLELEYEADIATVKVGKNGNAIYSLNTMGQVSTAKLRVIRGSADDQFLNQLLVDQQNNFAGTILLFGTFIKKIGDGRGNITSDTYIMSGGVFMKVPGAKTNVEGETDQSVTLYTMKFANQPASRAIT